MNRLIKSSFAVLALVLIATPASAKLIDFSTVDVYTAQGRIGRISDVSFSYDLFTHDDGFDHYEGITYNYYGEQNEYFIFDAPVTLNSMMLSDFPGLNPTNPLYVELFDVADQSLGIHTLNLGETLETFDFDVAGVKKVQFTFDGGIPFYGDGRDHAWYTIDDIDYNDSTPASKDSWSAVKALY